MFDKRQFLRLFKFISGAAIQGMMIGSVIKGDWLSNNWFVYVSFFVFVFIYYMVDLRLRKK